ncbi:NADH-quinone oxidoreductase subunit NuoE family protein [Alkaliphilus hydrothermalis]|uniref:NADH-quinone oxidoreductase subunit E/NADP-reducing hydrogenase subunit HndA n=1 Tax=Alkaliphilus hydrothermalis TaxID=1482730 RepID=A0ABS2NS71_9FIRM|nr:NAD(P)H-dependent oxidoreductase subunit E [Alkaliphilus hydrothermalis]MBM7615798.1 NADH-quinone oxidoreductase subunit E/NADP-reducing hydrogenase subunit HndA [Alkaliphilus hydrothermalis]
MEQETLILQEPNEQEKKLPNEKYEKLKKYIDELPEKEGTLIQVLHKAQEIFGYLPRDVQLFVARALGVSGAKVYGVVSFYNYFNDKPRGEYLINVCTGTACFVKGCGPLLESLSEKLGVGSGQTTEDGKFTLNGVRCIGACGLAPVIIVDDQVYGRVKLEEIDKIIAKYR